MSVHDNLRVVDAAFEAINARDWDWMAQLYADSVIEYRPGLPEPSEGSDVALQNLKDFTTAFPDVHVEKVRAFGQGDWVCREGVLTGTHKGPLTGADGKTIPVTNKPIRLQRCNLFRVEDGKITERHLYFDQLGFMTQLGLAPQG